MRALAIANKFKEKKISFWLDIKSLINNKPQIPNREKESMGKTNTCDLWTHKFGNMLNSIEDDDIT